MTGRVRMAPPRRKQSGLILLLLVGVLGLGATYMMLRAFNEAAALNDARLSKNALILEEAKAALVMYVSGKVATESYPGKLPCPENTLKIGTANEGDAQNYCSLPAVGRLPWKTLGYANAPLDLDGEQLWYAVSPGFNRASVGTTLTINSNTPAGLTVDDSPARAVALIFSPGRVLAGQTRSAVTNVSPPAAANYLDLENATPDIKFATHGPSGSVSTTFNDQVAIVSHQDLFNVVEPAVAKRIETDLVPILRSVYDSVDWNATSTTPRFPFPAPFSNPDTNSYTGVAATDQGLLPLSYSKQPGSSTDCVVSGSDPRCNPTLIAWKTGSGLSYSAPLPITSSTLVTSISVPTSGAFISVQQVWNSDASGTLSGLDCSGTTSAQISCIVKYGRHCSSYPSTTCGSNSVQPRVRLTVRGLNIANAFKEFELNTASLLATQFTSRSTATSYGASPLGVLRSDGDADITTEWLLPSKSCTSPVTPATCANGYTITIPIALIVDHAVANSAYSVTGWFLANEWHKLTYYALSSGYAPGGNGSCVAGGPPACLTLNSPSGTTSPNALLILAGRPIGVQARPSGILSNYLESENLSPVDSTFVTLNRSLEFNDRVVVVGTN